MSALGGINQIRQFKPSDWESLPEQRVEQEARTYHVFEMPGEGTFSGMGTAGKTKMRLWVDEETFHPAKLMMLLKSGEQEDWRELFEMDFLWDKNPVPADFFEPKYPATAKVEDRRSEDYKSLQEATKDEMMTQPVPEAPSENIVTLERDGKSALTLEKAWIHPSGILVIRLAFGAVRPFGQPPNLEDPKVNSWGLGPDEIHDVTQGQIVFDKMFKTQQVTCGGIQEQGRWAGYEIYRFEPVRDKPISEKLTYRHLMPRRRQPSDGGFQAYINAALNDPSLWHLYEFTITTQDYIVGQIPEEIYNSSNLQVKKVVTVFKDIISGYETSGSHQQALDFIMAQGPKTQHLLKKDRERLEKLLQDN